MKKASEYRHHAQECRDLAAQMDSAPQRELMLHMAEHWEKLAADRIALIQRHPEIADDDVEPAPGPAEAPGPRP